MESSTLLAKAPPGEIWPLVVYTPQCALFGAFVREHNIRVLKDNEMGV
jgi:hypothetical protein